MVLNKPILGAPNFTLAELIRSATAEAKGIDNTPTQQQAENLRYLARNVLQPIRDHFGVPIRVSSGYRSPALNKAVKGSPASFHSHGMAADIEFKNADDGKLIDIFHFVYDQLPFTELIAEELPAKVSADRAYQNAMKNSDKQNARIEHDKALERAVIELLSDHTELFKQFSDNPSFKKWLSETIFTATYADAS